MKRIVHLYNKFEEYVLVGSLVVTVTIIFVQVIMRYIFNSSLSWSEELARYIFIWQTWLGASIGIREKKHIKVELIYGLVKGRGKKVVDIIASFIWLAFSIFITINGTQLILDLIQKGAISSGMRIPMYFVYVSLPISTGVIALRLVMEVYETITGFAKPERGEA
ncbi:MAG: TRAP transporter small permease [Caulobacteraceae bacterium]